MKNLYIHGLFLTGLFFCFTRPVSAQDDSKTAKNLPSQWQTNDEPPIPPGGKEGYLKFLKKNIKYPQSAIDSNAQGMVYVSILVDKEGSLSDIHIYRDMAGYGCGEEAVRVIKSMPQWKPGMMNGVPVKVRYTIPVSFTLYDLPGIKAKHNSLQSMYDEDPVPPGGINGFNEFISKNLIYPKEAFNLHDTGCVEVSIIVDIDGTVSDIRIEKDKIGHGCGDEAIRLIRMIPKWEPAKFMGKPVKVRYTTKVNFKLP